MVDSLFYISIVIAFIAGLLAMVCVGFYLYRQIQICKDVQSKLIATIKLTEQAHQVTLEALQCTEDLLTYLTQTVQEHDETHARIYSRLCGLESCVHDLKHAVNTSWQSK